MNFARARKKSRAFVFLVYRMSMNEPEVKHAGSVENNGFEPLTPCVQGRCSSQLS